MDELLLPISYKGQDMDLHLRMFAYGWTFRIGVKIGEAELLFEPDEEGALRALGEVEIEPALVRIIAEQLEKLR